MIHEMQALERNETRELMDRLAGSVKWVASGSLLLHII